MIHTMSYKSVQKTVLFCIAGCLALTSAHGIKISIPKQYEDQVEAIKAAEQAERERQINDVTEGNAESEPDLAERPTDDVAVAEQEIDAQSTLVESIAEAASAVSEMEDAPVGKGFVSGQIVDKETGQPIPGVAILFEGTDIGTITGRDGRYTLGPADAGEYTISFIKTGYIEANVTEFQVVDGEVSVFPFALPPRPAEMSDEVYVLQDFTVSAEEANSMMTQLELKLSSTNVLSALSAEDFSKFAASDIADAVKKVSGVSVVGGKYAVIRGLGDRYVSSTLNGLPIASPDPDRQAVQLDIFPSALFQSLEVTKSFTPDQPANSTGGINMNIKDLPDEFFANFSLSTGGNSRSTGEDEFLTNDRGNSRDDYAAGAEGRGLPTGIGELFDSFNALDDVASNLESSLRGARRPSTFNRIRDGILAEFPDLVIADGDIPALEAGVAQVRGLADDLQSQVADSLAGIAANRHAKKDSVGPDYGGKFSIGDSFAPNDFLRLGYIGSFNYSRKYRLIEDADYFRSSVEPQLNNLANSLNPVNFEDPFFADGYQNKKLTQAKETTSLSWMFGIGLEINDNHKIRAHRMDLSVAENINSRLVGDTQADFPFSDDNPQDFLDVEISESLYYQERELISDQLMGQHRFEADFKFLEFIDVNWGLGRDEAKQDEPGFVQTTGILLDDPDTNQQGDRSITFSQTSTSPNSAGEQYVIFREIAEERETERLDVSFITEEGSFQTKFKIGVARNDSERRILDQYLTFQGLADGSADIPTSDDPENDSAPLSGVDETPFVSLGTAADVDITTETEGSYFLLDQKVTDKFRFIGGLRSESNFAAVSASGDGVGGIPEVRGAGVNNPFIGLPTDGGYDVDDVYPGLSLVFTPFENFSMRFAFSQTIALPSSREIAPYASSQFIGGDVDVGNPNLAPSEVESYDLGFSYFSDQGDSVSLTVFYKNIADRIEKIGGLGIEPGDEDPFDSNLTLAERFPSLFLESQNLGASLNSWYNNPNEATLKGFEIEANKQLAFLGDVFENLSVGGNFTYIEGEVDRFPIEIVSKDVIGRPVSDNRTLTDQPETIVNFDLTYDDPDLGLRVSLIYYRISEVLDSTSLLDSYDVFKMSYDQVDLTASKKFENGFKISASLKNLTDSERGKYFEVEGSERNRDLYKVGISYSISGSFEF